MELPKEAHKPLVIVSTILAILVLFAAWILGVSALRDGAGPLASPAASASARDAPSGPSRPEPATPGTIRLSFIGDIMSHDVNTGMRDYSLIWKEVPELREDDASFGNFESPIVPGVPDYGYPCFNSNAAYLEAAIDGGVDFFALANNHSNDRSKAGILATWGVFADAAILRGIAFAGIRRDAASPFPFAVRLVKGLRIGFAAVTSLSNAPEKGGLLDFVDLDGKYEESLAALAARAREWRSSCDFLVLSIHDEREYTQAVTKRQRKAYAALARAGVDVLWAHHPHVPRTWEVLEVERAGRGEYALVLYSMGNFISGMTWYTKPGDSAGKVAPTGDSLLVEVELGPSGGLLKVEPRFYANWKDPLRGMVVRPVDDLAADPSLKAEWRRFYATRSKAMALLGEPWSRAKALRKERDFEEPAGK